MRIRQSRNHRVPAEVDHLGRGQRCLVHPDAAGDRVARNRERTLGRELRIEGADDPVLEDHPRNLLTGDQRSVTPAAASNIAVTTSASMRAATVTTLISAAPPLD